MSEREPSNNNVSHNSNKKSIRNETRGHTNTARMSFKLLHIIGEGQRFTEAKRKLPWRCLTLKFVERVSERPFVLLTQHSQFEFLGAHFSPSRWLFCNTFTRNLFFSLRNKTLQHCRCNSFCAARLHRSRQLTPRTSPAAHRGLPESAEPPKEQPEKSRVAGECSSRTSPLQRFSNRGSAGG